MKLQERIGLLGRLGEYMQSADGAWREVRERASQENGWFAPEFLDRALSSIAVNWLQPGVLEDWIRPYAEQAELNRGRQVGIVMAGNIPLVGFHDWLAVFLSGHRARIKLSSRDKVLLPHLTDRLVEWQPGLANWFSYEEQLRGCEAYLATGSNNSARYFDYYFSRYPHVIRRNKTSVAVLDGRETPHDLEALADDVLLYFGMGCRNVTKLYVPAGYEFGALLEAFKKYSHLADHHKYKNNYDYNLALLILNKQFYMTDGTVLLVENPSLFSPVSQLHYEFYTDFAALDQVLSRHPDLQARTGRGGLPFGQAQSPALTDYADGINTLAFLAGI